MKKWFILSSLFFFLIGCSGKTATVPQADFIAMNEGKTAEGTEVFVQGQVTNVQEDQGKTVVALAYEGKNGTEIYLLYAPIAVQETVTVGNQIEAVGVFTGLIEDSPIPGIEVKEIVMKDKK